MRRDDWFIVATVGPFLVLAALVLLAALVATLLGLLWCIAWLAGAL